MEIERVKERVMEGRPGFTRQYGPARTDHQPGIPFWPQEIARDMVVIFFLVAILFFLSAFVTPFLGPARSIGGGEIIVPDSDLLFSWGLLKAADVLPQFQLGPAFFGSQLWGEPLSGIPVIPLLLLPFLDRGRESRPAKAPIRSAVGLGAIVAIFTSSLYSVREIIGEIWHTPDIDPNPLVVKTLPLIPDGTLKLFLIVPPILVGLATFVGLRRLGFRPMRTALLAILPAPFFVLAAIAAAMLFLPGGLPELSRPFALQIAVVLAIFVGTAGAGTLAALLHVRIPAQRVLPVRQMPHRVSGHEGRGGRPRRAEPRVQHVQEAARRGAPVDLPCVRRMQRRVPSGHPVQRLHPRAARGTHAPPRGGRRGKGMMETEYGPGRTIPHPLLFR